MEEKEFWWVCSTVFKRFTHHFFKILILCLIPFSLILQLQFPFLFVCCWCCCWVSNLTFGLCFVPLPFPHFVVVISTYLLVFTFFVFVFVIFPSWLLETRITFCFSFFAKHTIVRLVEYLFRNIHSSLQCSSCLLIHASLYDFFSTCMYVPHYASCPWSQCAQFLFLSFVTIKHFGVWAFKQISWTMEGMALVFVFWYILIHIFTINIIWFIHLVLTFPHFYFIF